MTYRTVYDVHSDYSVPIAWLLIPLCAGLLLFLDSRFRREVPASKARHDRVFISVAVICGVVFYVFGAAIHLRPWLQLRDAQRKGSVNILTGPIQQFKPMDPSGHGSETFVLDGQALSIIPSQMGYCETSNFGGVLREGLKVRIQQYRGCIAKLEIAEDDKGSGKN